MTRTILGMMKLDVCTYRSLKGRFSRSRANPSTMILLDTRLFRQQKDESSLYAPKAGHDDFSVDGSTSEMLSMA